MGRLGTVGRARWQEEGEERQGGRGEMGVEREESAAGRRVGYIQEWRRKAWGTVGRGRWPS